MSENKNEYVGFCGPSNKLSAPRFDAQRAVNLYVELNPLGIGKENQTGVLLATPGLRPRAEILGGPVRGFHALSSGTYTYACAGNRVYASSDNFVTSTFIGSVATSEGPVSFADNGSTVTPTNIMMVDGSAGYRWTRQDPVGTFQRITDPGFVPASIVQYQDHFFICNYTGTDSFFVSDFDNTTFSESAFSPKAGYGDKLKAVFSNNRVLHLLGEKTLEYWWNSGASPVAPFSRTDGQFNQVGCYSAASLCKLNDSFFWLGPNEQGSAVVWAMAGGPQRISNHAVEFALQQLTANQLSQATAWAYQRNGHYFYGLNVPGLQSTWVYDTSSKLWHERQSTVNGYAQRHLARCMCFCDGEIIASDYLEGKIYVLDEDYVYDGTNPIEFIREAPHISSSLNNVSISMLQLDCQAGVGLETGTAAAVTPHLTMQVSRDGGQTWGPARKASLGKIGKWQTRQRWHRLGYGRDIVIRVTCSDPVKLAILSAWLVLDVGNS